MPPPAAVIIIARICSDEVLSRYVFLIILDDDAAADRLLSLQAYMGHTRPPADMHPHLPINTHVRARMSGAHARMPPAAAAGGGSIVCTAFFFSRKGHDAGTEQGQTRA